MADSARTLAGRIARLRSMHPQQVLRTIFLRTWPLSFAARGYYRLRYWEPIYDKVLNRRSRREHAAHPLPLDALSRRIADDLRRDGIAMTTVDELTGEKGVHTRLVTESSRMLRAPHVAEQIEQGESKSYGNKHYLVRAFDAWPMLEPENAFVNFALNDRVLAPANHYLGLAARLKTLDLWCNLPVSPDSPVEASQRWHRDYDDQKLVKVFVYLNDVDAGMGPFTYVKGTHLGGALRSLWPSRPPEGAVPAAGAVEKRVPAVAIQSCTGGSGTVIFCDTSGLHSGGRSTTRPRILFVATYATDAAIEPDRYRLPADAQRLRLSRAGRFAVRREREA